MNELWLSLMHSVQNSIGQINDKETVTFHLLSQLDEDLKDIEHKLDNSLDGIKEKSYLHTVEDK